MAHNIAELLQFLVLHLLLESWWCERCGELCPRDLSCLAFGCHRRHVGHGHSHSKRVWRHCYYKSMLCGTWFSQVRLSVLKVCQLNCLWLNLPFPRQSIIQTELGVSSRTVVNWSSFCREVCIFWLDKESVLLGDPGVVVEIDEAKMGKQKYNKDRWIDGQWVFGGFEHGTKNCFLVPVPSRGLDVLLQLIKQWIRPGTIMVSDCWKSFDCLGLEGFVHEKVNHSKNFVDPSRVRILEILNALGMRCEKIYRALVIESIIWLVIWRNICSSINIHTIPNMFMPFLQQLGSNQTVC